MKLWIVGKFVAETESGIVWEFQGLFDSPEKAAAACRMPNYFIGPVEINQEIPDEQQSWPNAYYPGDD